MTCYTPCHRELAAYCDTLARTHEDARDLMSDTVEIGFRKFKDLKDKSKFKVYLFGIASKLFQNQLRTVYRRKNEPLEVIQDLQQLKIPESEVAVDYQIALAAIKKLPPDQQEAIMLFELSGFSIHEIADIQETNDNTVKTRLSRGREKLKTLLTETTKLTSHGKH